MGVVPRPTSGLGHHTLCILLALLSLSVVVCNARTVATLAAFNIQIFGETKINKPEVVRDLVTVCRTFDFVAIQVGGIHRAWTARERERERGEGERERKKGKR